jgi:23S rRNA (adenine2503-C2)-methyltransferase
VTQKRSDDGLTTKWLWRLDDGALVETVLMRYPVSSADDEGPDDERRGRTTVCVSSQAGCAMACSFCATGQAGYERHLRSGEIVEQVVAAMRAARPDPVTNVVFMGMGEPLANESNVWAAVERLRSDFGMGARRITISTVGLVPAIDRMTERDTAVNLAVSLHASTDVVRDTLVPINRRHPIATLVEACARWTERTGRRLSFEWALIHGVNDTDEQIDGLTRLALPLGAHVNLIPLNPTPGYLVRGSAPERVRALVHRLRAAGVTTTVRHTRGVDIDAACGQLRAGHVIADQQIPLGRRGVRNSDL